MTAVVIAAQPNAGLVHVATDAAMYSRDGVIQSFGQKTYNVAHWPGLIVTVGNAAMTPLFGWALAQEFRTFDDMIEGVEASLPSLVQTYQLPSGAEIILAGISNDRGPEAYACRTDDRLPAGMTREDAEASEYWVDAPFTLTKLGDLTMNPVPADQVVGAHYEGIDPDADVESVVWSMRKIVEMQRHMKLPKGIGIGGFAQCTTISRAGIVTRMLQEWNADVVGEPINAGAIDWQLWHADNPKPVASAAPLQPAMSRLRRDVDARKGRKGLRLVGAT